MVRFTPKAKERLGAQAEHEAARRHHRERPAERGEHGAREAQHAEDERGAADADAVDDDPADQHHHDVGEGVDGVQQADVGVGEAELRLEDVGQGADRVVDVVVPEHGQADQDEDGPAEGLRRLEAGYGGVAHGAGIVPRQSPAC
jgi:hypothetical protein